MPNYIFMFQATKPNNQITFTWKREMDDTIHTGNASVKRGETVRFSLLPIDGETMESLSLMFKEVQKGEPIAPFVNYGEQLWWHNHGMDVTLDQITEGAWAFWGSMTGVDKDGQPVTYTLADPEVVVGDGP